MSAKHDPRWLIVARNKATLMSFDLYIKFLLFYFELYRRLIDRLLSLHNKALGGMLSYFEKNFLFVGEPQAEENPDLQPFDRPSQRILADTTEDFYSTIAMVMKFLNEKLIEMINAYSIDTIDIIQFHKLQAFFEVLKKCFESQMRVNETVSEWLKTDNQALLSVVNKVKAGYMDKIAISPLSNLKSECEKSNVFAS